MHSHHEELEGSGCFSYKLLLFVLRCLKVFAPCANVSTAAPHSKKYFVTKPVSSFEVPLLHPPSRGAGTKEVGIRNLRGESHFFFPSLVAVLPRCVLRGKASPCKRSRHAVRQTWTAGLSPRAQLKGERDEQRAGDDGKRADPEHKRHRAGTRKKREQHAQSHRGDPA